jgi:hypothetical protein
LSSREDALTAERETSEEEGERGGGLGKVGENNGWLKFHCLKKRKKKEKEKKEERCESLNLKHQIKVQ